jgi:hypothetical protein
MQRHTLTLAALFSLSAGVQAWCVSHAVTPAQDAVRYVQAAESIERNGLLQALRTRQEQPLFPATVWLTYRCSAAWRPPAPDAWTLSAQFVSAAGLVLAVLPVYGLLLSIARWPAAAIGTALFSVMAPVARLGADALSDSTHLCLLCAALWAAARWFHTNGAHKRGSNTPASPLWLLAAGMSLALASLARKEAFVLAPAIGLAMAVLQFTTWRQPWRGVAAGSITLCVGMAIVLGPFLAASDALSPRRAVARLLGHPLDVDLTNSSVGLSSQPSKHGQTKEERSSSWRTADGKRMAFDKKDSQSSIRFRGYTAAAMEFARELPKAFNYWIGAVAVWGLWTVRSRPWQPPGVLLLVFVALYSTAAIRFASHSGYLAPRHLLPLVVIGLAWAGEGAAAAMRNLECGMRNCLARLGRLVKLRDPHTTLRASQFRIPHSAFTVALLAACLPQTLAPLHVSRLGHRQAAEWLAAQEDTGTSVLDTRGFTQLFSGHKTYAFEDAKRALRDPQLAYVVVERRELGYDSRRGRTLRELLSRGAQSVACFALDMPGVEPVEVYRWTGPLPVASGEWAIPLARNN